MFHEVFNTVFPSNVGMVNMAHTAASQITKGDDFSVKSWVIVLNYAAKELAKLKTELGPVGNLGACKGLNFLGSNLAEGVR